MGYLQGLFREEGRRMICPNCKQENDDNWLLDINNGKIVYGGCQDCWEGQCADEWWVEIQKL